MAKAGIPPFRRTAAQLRELRANLERERRVEQERRRAEDRIREELHDLRAKTIHARKK